MKKISIIIGIFIGAVIIGWLFFGLITQQGNKLDNPIDNNTKLLNLNFKDYNGQDIKLADLGDRFLVVNSWASWCSFCKKELVEFAQVKQEMGDDIEIVIINRAESLKKSKKYTDELGIGGELLTWLDTDDLFYREIGGFSMPETIFINQAGEIVFHKRGAMNAQELKRKINEFN